MYEQLLHFFLLIMAGCGALFMLVFTFWLVYGLVSIVIDMIKDVCRYASGKHKDNERA